MGLCVGVRVDRRRVVVVREEFWTGGDDFTVVRPRNPSLWNGWSRYGYTDVARFVRSWQNPVLYIFFFTRDHRSNVYHFRKRNVSLE